jgi:gamma-glutamylcyclotransferase (GGCT)/AIG2-like uncharacterized protein YtfP
MANVFTYGILMSDAQVGATLQNYRLDFGYHATVVEEVAGITYGGLVQDVCEEGLRRYDSIEGVRGDGSGYYARRLVAVTAQGIGPVEAWVYVMNPRYLATAKYEMGARYDLGHLTWRMGQQYDRLHLPPYAHDELEHRVEQWHREGRG